MATAPSASGAVTFRNFDDLSLENQARALSHVEDPLLVDDEDNPAITEADIRSAIFFDRPVPASEITPELLRKAFGRPKSAAPKQATKLRLDPDVLAAFKAEGPGWQTRMNAALREAMPKPKPVKRSA